MAKLKETQDHGAGAVSAPTTRPQQRMSAKLGHKVRMYATSTLKEEDANVVTDARKAAGVPHGLVGPWLVAALRFAATRRWSAVTTADEGTVITIHDEPAKPKEGAR